MEILVVLIQRSLLAVLVLTHGSASTGIRLRQLAGQAKARPVEGSMPEINRLLVRWCERRYLYGPRSKEGNSAS